MSDNKIIEGVGRKIVDALKQQSQMDVQNVVENVSPIQDNIVEDNEIEFNNDYNDSFDINQDEEVLNNNSVNSNYTPTMTFTHQQSFKEVESFASDLDELDMPTNVAVLRQLISKLPSGVSKQTGALIIKQTMEALGISMKNVLQEAQQLQDNLNNKSKECQASIAEYKKQINILERQSQKFQRQSSSLNDIISLFVQTAL